MIKRAFLILLCLIFMIFHADLVTKGAVSGLLLWYSSVVPALFPFMVLSSVLSASGGVQALMRPFPVIFRFAGLSADGWYGSPHRSSLRLPHGSKDMCRSLRGRADQLRGGEISLCTLQSSKSHVSRRFRLSHVCFPGPFVIFCLFYLRTSTPSRGPGQPDLPERTRPDLLSGQLYRKGTDEVFRDHSQRRDHDS